MRRIMYGQAIDFINDVTFHHFLRNIFNKSAIKGFSTIILVGFSEWGGQSALDMSVCGQCIMMWN